MTVQDRIRLIDPLRVGPRETGAPSSFRRDQHGASAAPLPCTATRGRVRRKRAGAYSRSSRTGVQANERRDGDSSCRFPPTGMRTYVLPMIVCVLLPRFELAVAAGGREALAAAPLALAPQIGREQLVG